MSAGKDKRYSRTGPLRWFRLLSSLAFAAAFLAVPARAAAQTELGSEDDLTVLGKDGTAVDPDAEIKGFAVFGATQAAYTGAAAGAGNVVVNGVLAVSSGAYFVGNSTFTAANRIFVNDGSDGQVLTKNGATGALQWNNVSSMVAGDNLGNHVATTTLNMAGFNVVGVSTISVSSITTSAAGVTVSSNVFVAGRLGVGTSDPRARLDMVGNELRLGPVSYPASYSTTNSGYLVMDKSGTAGDASIVFRDQGNARAEIGIVTDNDIHFKTVAGSYGAETFTDRLLIRGTGEIDAFGLLRSYGTSGVSRIFAGNSDGAAAGAALELSYDFDNTLARITSIERGNVYRNLLVEGNNLIFNTGAVTLSEAMRVTDNGYVGIGTAAPAYRLVVSSGAGEAGNMLVISTGTSDVIRMTGDGSIYANKFYGDISGATGLPAGDNLGNHTATQALDMSTFPVVNVSSITMLGDGIRIATSVYAGASGVFISAAGSIMTLGMGNGSAAPNARGIGAVDMQTYRNAATQVAGGSYSTISGGNTNTAGSIYSVVSGGQNNTASNNYAVVSGGSGNTASGNTAVVSGGVTNTAGNSYAAISGGMSNKAYGQYTAISGGASNAATMDYAAVVGGYQNKANGTGSAVSGGEYNTAKGNYSWAGGYYSSSTANGSFTWADSQGGSAVMQNAVADRTVFKNRGGFLITGSTDPYMTGAANRGVLVTGAGRVGISTGTPGAALDVVADGSASTDFAQIWRNASGVEVASMTSTGVLYATIPPGAVSGDNLGNHTATQALNMNGKAVDSVSSMTVTGAGVSGSDPLLSVAGSTMTVLNNGNVGIGTAAPGYKLEVRDTGMAGFQVSPQNGYVSLLVNGVEVARMKP